MIRIFSKIRKAVRKSRCTTGINDTGGKFAPGVNVTGSKFATGINDTGGKFFTGINDTGWWLPVSLTPVANLPPVSLIPVVHLELRISPQIFEKIRNGPNGVLRGLGETDS
jgi:hypothetical protein